MDERLEQRKDAIKVSIIVPVYNVSAYIERCIKSVMAQTYTNIECIIVDDVTPDDSIEKCVRLIAGYRGSIAFTILHHEKNRGLSAARNTGTEASTGEYVYYLDSDDEITEQCISILVEAVHKHPGVELVQGKIEAIPYRDFYNRAVIRNIEYTEDNLWIRKHFYRLERQIPLNAWDKLLKKSFLKQYSLSFKEGLIHEDQQWMFFVVKHLTKYAVVHETTYIHYCGTDGSIMSTSNREREAYHWSVILNDVINNLDTPLFDQQLLCYLRPLVSYYGYKGKVPYPVLARKYGKMVLKRKFYAIFLSFALFVFFFPVTQGRGFRRIVRKLLYTSPLFKEESYNDIFFL